MTKFLDLTIKIDGANKYKNDTKEPANHRIIELAGPIKIKERNGSVISQIKDSSFGSRYSVNKIKFVKLLFTNLDIPISWAWENKKAAASIEFTLEKLKYDEVAGLEITHSNPDSTIKNLDTLVLNPNDFEVEQLEMRGEQFSRYWQMIKLAINNEGSTFEDFEKLRWKITKAYEDEQVANLVPEIKAWEKASILDDGEEYNFYNLVNINDGKRRTKEFCDFWLKKIEDLKEWKNYGIKTLIEADIAENNFFDITAEPGLKSRISSDAKYRGFSIINNEKQKVLTDEKNNSFNSNSDFQVKIRNRYNKLNIDCFRDCFSNDPDQTEPQYFRGFHVGEIGRINESFYSIYHQKDIKNKKFAAYLIEKDYTRTYYEFKSYFKFDENDFQPYQLLLIILRKEAFDEIQTKQQKTRKECLDIYWEWLKKFWPLDMIENKDMKN